jgi:hypothetical protein
VRALMRYFQRRSHDEEYQQRVQQRIARPDTAARYQPQDQPDRQRVPATGGSATTGSTTRTAAGTPDLASAANQPVDTVELQEMVGPLAQYLLAFHELIELLRSRRRESDESMAGGRTLSEADRAGFQETLDRLEALVPNYGPGNIEDNSLQERVYRLTVKVRDALQNRFYGDDDLFRINGEVRSETCRMLAEIQWAGADTSPDFEQVRQAYDCG